MQFSRAYICYSCHEVFEKAPYGKCQVCSSCDVYPLSWLGRPQEERSRWFNLISGEFPKRQNAVRNKPNKARAMEAPCR
jgi:hypothetical protein